MDNRIKGYLNAQDVALPASAHETPTASERGTPDASLRIDTYADALVLTGAFVPRRLNEYIGALVCTALRADVSCEDVLSHVLQGAEEGHERYHAGGNAAGAR